MSEPRNKNPQLHDRSRDSDHASRSHDRDAATLAHQRAAVTLFTTVMDAGELTGEAREAKIAESVSLIRETPSLGAIVEALLLDDLDDEPAIYEEAREAMLFASDPHTGIIQDDHVFPEEFRDLIETAPELQAYREELIAEARAEDDARWDVLAKDAQRRIDARPKPQPTSRPHAGNQDARWAAMNLGSPRSADTAFWNRRDHVSERSWVRPVDDAATLGAMAFVTRDALANEEPPVAEVIYNDEPTYRLNENRFRDASGKIEVTYDLFKPGTEEPLVASREDWRVFPFLDGELLPVVPCEDTDTSWKLKELIAKDDLKRVTYDVALSSDGESSADE